MLKIANLSVSIADKPILNHLNLALAPGSVHVLMGPNGSGKSTLAFTLIGHPAFTVLSGSMTMNATDITHLPIDKRAQIGLFLAFQHPYEIPGVTVLSFLKEAYHACAKTIISMKDFQELVYNKMALLEMDKAFAHRPLHYGFSGGEKKRLEILQMLVLKPKILILDEIDSGLDVDALKIVAQGLHIARTQNPDLSMLIITHYPRLLSYIEPDFVHIMHKGSIVETGSAELAFAIEARGYDARNL